MLSDPSDVDAHIVRLLNEGNALIRSGRFQEAQECLSNGSILASSILAKGEGQPQLELQFLISLSACKIQTGDSDGAKIVLQEALLIATALNDERARGNCLLNLGVLHVNSAPWTAKQFFQDALHAFEIIEYRLGIAQCLDNIGFVYQRLGMPRHSIVFMNRALNQLRAANQPYDLAVCEEAIANVLTDMANDGLEDSALVRPIAEQHYNSALRAFEELGAHAEAAHCLDAIGLLKRDEGKLDEAVELHERATQTLCQLGAMRYHSSALLNLGTTLERKDEYDKAITALRQARKIKHAMNDVVGLARLSHNEGAILNKQQRYDEAAESLLDAIRTFEGLAAKVKDDEIRAAFASELYESWIEYLFALSQREKGEAAIAHLALELERSRVSALLSYLREVGCTSDIDDKNELDQLHLQIDLRRKVADASVERTSLRRRVNKGFITRSDFESRIEALISRTQSAFFALQEIRSVHERGELPEITPVDLKTVLSEVILQQGGSRSTVFLFMVDFHSKQKLGLGVIGTEHCSFEIVGLDDPDVLFSRLRRFFNSKPRELSDLAYFEKELNEISKQLGDLLLKAKVSQVLQNVSDIILIPDGIWHMIPWEIAQLADEYLGTSCSLIRHYSATLLKLLNSRLTINNTEYSQRTVQIYAPTMQGLPGCQQEIAQVGDQLFGRGYQVRMVQGEEVTQECFVRNCRDVNLRILHFAGHSKFSTADPLLSSLFLSKNPAIPSESGELSALEIERRIHFSNAPFVYLSSCESAVAHTYETSDTFGLIRAFLMAGASSLLLSNWFILDSSAPDFATLFYEAGLQGHSCEEAARIARVKVSERASNGWYGDMGNLIHWGPYCLYGSPLTFI